MASSNLAGPHFLMFQIFQLPNGKYIGNHQINNNNINNNENNNDNDFAVKLPNGKYTGNHQANNAQRLTEVI